MGRDGKLPKEILSLVSAHLQRDERILFAQASDLTLDRRFGPCHMVITDARIAVFDGDKLALTLELTRIKKIKVDELFGSARLVAETSEGDRHLIYYSKAYVPQFAGLCRVVSDLLDGRQPVPPEERRTGLLPEVPGPVARARRELLLVRAALPNFQTTARLAETVPR